MPLQLWDLLTIHLRALMRFRGTYLRAQEVMANRGRFNIPEFAMVHTRGGRRVPLWMKNIDAEVINSSSNLPALELSQLQDYYAQILDSIKYFAIVPKTKASILAQYLIGAVCGSAQQLSDFAGVSLSTAHNWLRECSEIKILMDFRSAHEVFYLHPSLIELALTNRITKNGNFKIEFNKSIELLYDRRNWLEESKLASFYH